MVANLDNTGSLIVTQPLDYENPLQRNGFRFQIQVIDQVRGHKLNCLYWKGYSFYDKLVKHSEKTGCTALKKENEASYPTYLKNKYHKQHFVSYFEKLLVTVDSAN